MKNRLLEMIEPLCSWYEENHRELPWRENPTPYKVWISEIMLQQTRVEAVKPYFLRFMKSLPNVESLALVEDDELMKLWEGLGYYSRARNLKKAANVCVEQYGGQLPDGYEMLLELPGIGSYTAGAIASIAYHIPVPAVDGNVLRVVSRIVASRENIANSKVKKNMEQLLQSVIDEKLQQECEYKFDISVFNQAIMELGATVCIPNGAPLCHICPLRQLCLANQMQETDTIPVKEQKKTKRVEEKTVFLVHAEDKILLHKRPEKGLLAGMYEFPNLEGMLEKEEGKSYWGTEEVKFCGRGKHIFSHIQWNMIGYEVWLPRIIEIGENWIWVTEEEIKEQYSIPSAFKFINIK